MAANSALEHARASGDALVKAKAQCPHGEWGEWLAKHFSGAERTAQSYTRVANRWPEIEAKAQSSADLSLDGALKLLAAAKATKTEADTLESLQAQIDDLAEQFFADDGDGCENLSDQIVDAVILRDKAQGQRKTPLLLAAEARITTNILPVGLALRAIRDRRLCREKHDDVQSFCDDKEWGDAEWYIRCAEHILTGRTETAADHDLPSLSPDLRFWALGSHDDVIEIDPHPDHDGYYFLAHYHDVSSESPSMTYDMRGFRHTPTLLRRRLRQSGFEPSGPWESEPAIGKIPPYVPTMKERWAIERANHAECKSKPSNDGLLDDVNAELNELDEI